ncbi:MAG TPA: M1 family aminopeptidase, partial [Phycisphaerales bacterium]|nr:M1 family aminopeptidase [Phycisphaerales bacterium]
IPDPAECDKAVCGRQAAALLSAARGAAGRADGSPDADSHPEGKSRRPGIIDEYNGGGFTTREAMSATDVLHQNLDIEIVYSTQNISGSNTMTVKSLVNGLTQFTIRLRSQYNVSVCRVDGVNASISTPGSGSYGRTITLPRAYNAGEVFEVYIVYSGQAVSRGFGSIEFTTLNGQPGVFTLSEPYFAATWWPTKDGDFGQPGDNSDKFTMQFALTAPSTYVTASNGLLQGVDTLSGNRKRYRWASNYPIAPYLVSFGSTPYNTWTKMWNHGSGSMPVEFYISPSSDTSANRLAWEKCVSMLPVFGSIYGPYPFINEKYGIYHFVFGGGMEHQTITGQGGFGESLTAHELAHQWWGDNVTCKTWNHIWLNEGSATYGECLWEERKAGGSNLTALRNAINARKPSAVSGTVYRPDVTDLNAIFSSTYSYNKGAWVHHMLRRVVGDTAYFAGLLNYRAKREGGAATTEDFFADMGEVAGQDLTYFMNQWVYAPGAVQYQYGWQTVNINGQNYLRLYINQNQSASYPAYIMPIDVRVNGSATHVVQNTVRTQHFVVPIASAASSVAIDPDNWILETGKSAVAYVAGPPKIVQTTPVLGSVIDGATPPSAITVTFSEGVSTNASHYSISGPSGSVPFTFSYNAPNFTVTLTPTVSLDGGDYTVTVSDVLTNTAGTRRLDGEIANPTSAASLPSGDGLANGNAVWMFSLTSPCPADFDGSGFVDIEDFTAFVVAFEEGDESADYDGSGFVDLEDFTAFVTDFEAGC